MPAGPRTLLGVLLATTLLIAAPGCRTTAGPDLRYAASASVIEVISVLQQHVEDDTYRFEPARDFTGRNVYRSSLLRLESLERAYADALRAGHMDGVIAFAKGRALERIRAYDLAADAYRIAADREPALAEEALRSADLCQNIHEALSLGKDLEDTFDAADAKQLELPAPAAAIESFEKRIARLQNLMQLAKGTHHAIVLREEIERAEVERANYFVQLREVLPDGDVRAVSELQRVALRHADSKYSARHLLRLAELYADLSTEYVDKHPPESLDFDPVEFRELVDSGARIFEMVAARDGTPEKLEASRRLEAFLAFSIAVDRDRFTP
jgi:tetratricopeptide (TPR) repeat protein